MSLTYTVWLIALLLLTGLAVIFRRRSGAGLRDIPAETWFVASVCLITFVCASAMLDSFASERAALEVDMMVSTGDIVDVYLNGNYAEPKRLLAVPKERRVYRFEGMPQHIGLMRLDPTNANAAHVVLYSVRMKSGEQVLREFSPSELREWSLSALKVVTQNSGSLIMDSTTDDPMLSTTLSFNFPGSTVAGTVGRLYGPDTLFLLAMALFILWIPSRTCFRTDWGEVAIVAALTLMAYPLVNAAIRLKSSPPPVSAAVGFASYTGYPKGHDYYASFALLGLSLLLPLAGWRVLPRKGPAAQVPQPSSPSTAGVAHVLILILLLLYYQPNLAGGLAGLKNWQYQYAGWDDQHSLSWAYMINSGLRPFRDFWFPYSGHYITMLPFPISSLMFGFHGVLVLSFLYLGLFYIAGKKVTQALALFICLAIPLFVDLLPGWTRYMLAADVTFLAIAVGEMKQWEWKRPVLLATITGYVFFFEPTQVLYAGTGIAVYLALVVSPWGMRKPLRIVAACMIRRLARTLLYTGTPMLAGVVAAIGFFAANGMLPGLWEFEKSLGDQASYGGMNADIPGWVFPALHNDSVFLLLFILIAYGVYRWLCMRGRPDPLGATLLAICAVGFLAMQKQILRPHAMTQVRIFPFIALLLYGLLMWRERPRTARLLVGLFMGCMFAIASYQHLFQTAKRQMFAESAANLSGNWDRRPTWRTGAANWVMRWIWALCPLWPRYPAMPDAVRRRLSVRISC